MKRVLILFLLLTSVACLASGKDPNHVPSIKDLMWPAFNFVALFGFLIFKLKKPISEKFTKYSEDISAIFERADQKHREAIGKKEAFNKKMDQLSSEKEKILSDAHKDAENYRKKMSDETAQTFTKLESDMERKLESEHDAIVRAMNDELVNAIISSVKNEVAGHKDQQSKATGSLIASIK